MMKLKLNVSLGGYKAGQTINVDHVDGIPIARFWRDRLRDSARDNCVEVVGGKTTELQTDRALDQEPMKKTNKQKTKKQET